MRNDNYLNYIDKLLPTLPDYIADYYHAKRSIPLSPVTLYHYLVIYQHFFEWLREAKIVTATDNSMISLSDLENLKLKDMQLYKENLINRKKLNSKRTDAGLLKSSVNPPIAALKSLFKYLSVESENDNGTAYIDRNVMLKVPAVKDGRTLQNRAQEIESKLLLDNEDIDFINFIANQYEHQISAHQQVYFKRFKTRDLAIVAMFLSSGVRLSELCNLDMNDIDLATPSIKVTRKGGNVDFVYLRTVFLDYISDYIDQRAIMFPGIGDYPACFVTYRQSEVARIAPRTVEKMITRYSTAYGKPFSPHKLRHSLATKLYAKTHNEQLVRTQLGQTSAQSTRLYTHIVQQTQEDALKDL
ncbi:tyrosine recombinase XerS [Lactiplantibacillus plantarum]|uniref:tyrosine recombinase XerS n=1 Tax=Lactiplantibacillus plantarum TaxID=1590 RepID=UPI001BAC4977|nr:tyrosine recombinase XerS [Lactiplantibacillus plantarum]MBS0955011.1 tyrosine recombinase XerS [Lactiplantibacillus plantarum]